MRPIHSTPRRAEPVAPGLRRMRWVATGLLVAMAVTFLVARALGDAAAGGGFIRAFAEAAMVGGLADWFAVTALFRHPIGLPIPHTAIIPRNKDRIGTTLAAFLRDNFLIPRVVARRMHRVDVATAVGRWLAQRPRRDNDAAVGPVPLTGSNARDSEDLRRRRGDGRLRRGAWRLAVDLLGAFDPTRLGGMVKGAIGQRLRSLDLAPLLGQALHAAIADGRHLPLLDGTIRWAARILDANEHLVRRMVHDRAGSLLRWTGLDETLANKIIDGLSGMINDMADNPLHPLRATAEEGLAGLADGLLHDPVMQARVALLKAEIIANPAMQRWLDGLWEATRGGLLRVARDPDAAGRGQLGEALRQLGTTLLANAALRITINRFVRRTVVGFAADYGDGIVRLVSETVRGWDAVTITGRLENAVGRDLQYIRVNGTLVGGLVGVLIHAIDRWL